MKQVLDYNIHDLVKFRIVRNKKYDFRDLINLKFSSFRVDNISKPDIVLNIGNFTPSNQGCYTVDHKYRVKDNYLYCRDSGGKAGWEIEITGFETGDTVVNFNLTRNFATRPINVLYMPLFLPQTFLLRIIEHKLWQKNCFLAHAAAIAKDSQAYLLSGRGGCFKTTLCMEFQRRAGFTWLGDERVILHNDRVLAFPMNSSMFGFMVRHLPDETYWGFPRQLQFFVDCLCRRHEETEYRSNESAKLKAVLLLAKNTTIGADDKVIFSSVPQLQAEQIVDGLITSSKLEDFKGMEGLGIDSAPFLKYILAYSFVFPQNSFAAQERKLADNLRKSLKNVPIYKVEIPLAYNLHVFEQIREFLVRECQSS